MSEIQYAIRRADGGLIHGEYGWLGVEGPDDWGAATDDAEFDTDTADYEMLKMTIEVIDTRTYPRCSAPGCDEAAVYWGLCRTHADEDDHETVAEMEARDG